VSATRSTAPVAPPEIAPLSDFRGDLRGFLTRLSYASDHGGTTSRQARRYEGDARLLARLQPFVGPDGCVGELGEETLRDVVGEVEDELIDRWRLSGEESQPILERLDAHFAGQQEAWLKQRREQEAHTALLARDREMQRLDELRIGISVARQAVKDIQARVKAMERELAAQAKRLGLPAWP
jgi:molybdopterin converting factor small subunit